MWDNFPQLKTCVERNCMCGREKYVVCGIGAKSGNRKGESGCPTDDDEVIQPLRILEDPLHICG
jgi:hypothetical protein